MNDSQAVTGSNDVVTSAADVVSANVSQAAQSVTKRAGRPRDADSNMGKARAIFDSFPDPVANAGEVKKQFVSTLTARDGSAISKQTANTYFYLIKRDRLGSGS